MVIGQVSKYVWQNNNYIICNENQRVKFFVPYVRLSRDFGSFFYQNTLLYLGPYTINRLKLYRDCLSFLKDFSSPSSKFVYEVYEVND